MSLQTDNLVFSHVWGLNLRYVLMIQANSHSEKHKLFIVTIGFINLTNWHLAARYQHKAVTFGLK